MIEYIQEAVKNLKKEAKMKTFEVYHTETAAVTKIQSTIKKLESRLVKVFGAGFYLYQPNIDENFVGSFELEDGTLYHIYTI